MLNMNRVMADSYFASMSPMADKVQMDVTAVSVAFEPLWSRFTIAEQCDAINNRLIQPELVVRYAKYRRRHGADDDVDDGTDEGCLYDNRRLATFARQRTGFKRVPADGSFDYRDEHSRPFAWKTKSQLWLNIFDDDGNLSVTNDGDQLDGILAATNMKSTIINSVAAINNIDPVDLNDVADALPLLQFNGHILSEKIQSAGGRGGGGGGGGGFLQKFITSSRGRVGGCDDDDVDDDELRLMDGIDNLSLSTCPTSISFEDGKEASAAVTASSTLDLDDDRCGELNQLLNEQKNDLKTAYDFLNNW